MKGNLRTTMAYFILGYAASFLLIVKWEKKELKKKKKEMIVYISQESFSID